MQLSSPPPSGGESKGLEMGKEIKGGKKRKKYKQSNKKGNNGIFLIFFKTLQCKYRMNDCGKYVF